MRELYREITAEHEDRSITHLRVRPVKTSLYIEILSDYYSIPKEVLEETAQRIKDYLVEGSEKLLFTKEEVGRRKTSGRVFEHILESLSVSEHHASRFVSQIAWDIVGDTYEEKRRWEGIESHHKLDIIKSVFKKLDNYPSNIKPRFS